MAQITDTGSQIKVVRDDGTTNFYNKLSDTGVLNLQFRILGKCSIKPFSFIALFEFLT